MRSCLSRRAAKRPVASTLAVLLLYVLLAVVAAGANPFHETLAPMDLLLHFRGWDAVPDAGEVVHWQRSDILDHYLPQWLHLKRSFEVGDSLLWNPYVAGGVPGLQNLATGGLSPALLPLYLVDDPALGIYLASLIKMLVCGLGVFVLLRAWLCPLAAFFGGATFMLTGFNAAWFPWPHVATSMWIPWLLWAVFGHVRTRDPRWLPAVTACASLMMLGGFPAVAIYGIYAVVLLLAVWHFTAARGARESSLGAMAVLAAIGLAVVICAWPIAGLRELLAGVDLSSRTGGTSLVFPEDLLTFVAPLHPASRDVERTAYAGLLAASLAVVALAYGMRPAQRRLRPLLWFAMTLFALSAAVAFEVVPRAIIVMIPTFATNAYNRLTSLLGLAMAMLSAVGLDIVIRRCQRIQGLGTRGLLAALAVACVVQLVDAVLVFRRFNSVTPSAHFYPATPTLDFVAQHSLPLQSTVADFSFLFGGTLTAYRIPEWYAHHFRSNRAKALLSELVSEPFVSDTGAKILPERLRLGSALWSALGIRYVLVAADAELRFDSDMWRRHALEDNIAVLENLTVAPGAFWVPDLEQSPPPGGGSVVTQRSSNVAYEVSYEGNEAGFVVLPQRSYPGWFATVDGARVAVQDYLGALVAVPVSGKSQVVFRYEASTLRWAAWLSGLGMMLWLVGVFAAVWRRRVSLRGA